jgi:VanZ family protein
VVKLLKIPAWLALLGLVVVSVVPAAERPETGLQHDLEHFLAFAFAGLLVALAYPNRLMPLVAGVVVYALALEIIQIPLATRHSRLEDFVVDALGACAAIVLVYVARLAAGARRGFDNRSHQARRS